MSRPHPSPLPAPRPWLALLVLAAACRASAAPPAAPLAGAPAAGAEAARPAETPRAGALEIGDPYYPGLGNGGYDVEHYDLVLALDPDAEELTAVVTLRMRATHALASFSLDLQGLEVESVTVDGRAARFERPPGAEGDPAKGGAPAPPLELTIEPAEPLAEGALFSTCVRYSGWPAPRPDPAVPFLPGVGWVHADSGVYVVSECIGASSWYPCNDHPRDKATYSFRITVPRPYVAAANGLLREVLEEEETRTYVFVASDPLASYLATLNVAEFAFFDDLGPRGIPVRIYHPLDASEEELEPFRRQSEVLAFLETVFGPYPFEAAGGVISYEPIGGALECQTLPVYGRGCGLQVIVHELAHQWFGDCVSPDLWRDMWLNEGFASYASWLWSEHEEGRAAYEDSVRSAYQQLRKGRTGSPFDPGVGRVFSARVYTRGAMVLHGLRREVGDEAFFAILKSWVAEHHDQNGSTADFVAHAERVAARSLADFFAAWLYAEVTPELAEYEPGAVLTAPAGS